MNFLKLYKFFITPCLRLFGSYPMKFSSSINLQKAPPTPVPLAYSEYQVDDNSAITNSPLFILHGLLGSRSNWNTMSKSIAATTHRKVVALDLRNHGDSPHTEDFGYSHMIADLKQLMIEQGVSQGKASILGHSIGGRVAMALALESPGMVKDLVIVDVSPVGFPPGVQYIPRLLEALESIRLVPNMTLPEARKEASEQMKKFVRGEKLRNFLLTNLIIDEKTKKFVWKINVKAVKKNFPSLLQFPKFPNVYKGQCLFIGGERSGYLKKEDEEEIKKLFPLAKFEYVSGAGHLIHSEKPNVFLDIVCSFLNKNMSPVQ